MLRLGEQVLLRRLEAEGVKDTGVERTMDKVVGRAYEMESVGADNRVKVKAT